MSKVFERVIYTRLLDFLNHHNVIRNKQFGFRQSRSTELAIFHALTYIYKHVDKNLKVAGLYFDLSKAFDTLNHGLLLSKLEAYGIRGTCLNLIKSYLTDRTQMVCINSGGKNYFSETVKVEQGVPQGSILGPLLFILYVNDLINGFDAEMVCQYADDTSVLLLGLAMSDLSDGCSQASVKMAQWCEDNFLKLNTNKTGLLVFGKRNIQESLLVRLNNVSVPIVESVGFLGISLDSCLSWENHIEKLNLKLNSACAVIRRLRDVVSLNCIRIYYLAHIQSIINYGFVFGVHLKMR